LTYQVKVDTFVPYELKDKEKAMSNQKYTLEQKKDFYERLAAVTTGLPANYSTIIHERTKESKHVIRNVRLAKTINFTILEAFEALCQEESEKVTQ
jgi:hypothetical protein